MDVQCGWLMSRLIPSHIFIGELLFTQRVLTQATILVWHSTDFTVVILIGYKLWLVLAQLRRLQSGC